MHVDTTVHRVGDEEIFGKKIFHSEPTVKHSDNKGFVVSNEQFSIGENVNNETNLGRFLFSDKNDEWCGAIQESVKHNGEFVLSLIVRNQLKKTAFLSLGMFRDGTAYVACPSPTSQEECSNMVATTEWVSKRIDESINNAISSLKKELQDYIDKKMVPK